MHQAWLLLTSAIMLEVAGTTSMKLAAGFTHLFPSILIFVFYSLSFVALTLALNRIELSVAYAIWSGLGMVLITLIGAWYFEEPATLFKLSCIGLILLGVVGLNISAATA